jgi:hypothetical protein
MVEVENKVVEGDDNLSLIRYHHYNHWVHFAAVVEGAGVVEVVEMVQQQ